MKDETKKKLRATLLPVLQRAAPTVRVIERVGGLAVHLKRPTFFGVTGLAASAIAGVTDALGAHNPPSSTIEMLISKGQLIDAIKSSGGHVVVRRYMSGAEEISCDVLGIEFMIASGTGGLCLPSVGSDELFEWLRQAIDRVLPAAVSARRVHDRNYASGECLPFALTRHDNSQALAILRSTMPLLGDGRCILLNGRPGVGKTTMAQIIARESGLGRVVMIDGAVLGIPREHGATTGLVSSPGDTRRALRLLSPGTIIIDDIDKVLIPIGVFEALRSSAKLVILTANNGEHDEVLDGAQIRAGRVDEVFDIAPSGTGLRAAPYDRLDDETWAEVSQWPIAYLNEVGKRLTGRPDDLRLEDLRGRLARKTRSGSKLL